MSTEKREKWIEEKIKASCGKHVVMICNSELVKTGLDLVEFPTIIFYQTGYSIFTLRQAARRSFRIGQDKNVKVYYLLYEDSMQEKAMKLIASKLETSLAVEGELCDKGLAALSESGDSLIVEMAKALVDGIQETQEVYVKWKNFKKAELEKDLLLTNRTLKFQPPQKKGEVTFEQVGNKVIWLEVLQTKSKKKSISRIKITDKEKLKQIMKDLGQKHFQMLLPLI